MCTQNEHKKFEEALKYINGKTNGNLYLGLISQSAQDSKPVRTVIKDLAASLLDDIGEQVSSILPHTRRKH